MNTKYGSGSLKYLKFWTTQCGFPEGGSLSKKQLLKLEACLKEKEQQVRSKKRISKKSLEEIEGQKKCFDMWKRECESREAKQKRKVSKEGKHEGKALTTQEPQQPPPYNPGLSSSSFPRLSVGGGEREQEDWAPPPQPPREEAAQPPPLQPVPALYPPLPTAEISPPTNLLLSATNPFSYMTPRKPPPVSPIAKHTRAKQPTTASLQLPMIEFPGPDGQPVLVYRGYDGEMMTASSSLPPLTQGGETFTKHLLDFCKAWRPTAHELDRILRKILPADAYLKVSPISRVDLNFRAETAEWDDDGRWEEHIIRLVNHIKTTFPVKVNMEAIRNCKQEEGESFVQYFSRLTEACDRHSGHKVPAGGWGNEEGSFESVLKMALRDGTNPAITRAVQQSLIGGWSENRIVDIVKHCKHAELQNKEHTKKIKEREAKAAADASFAMAQLASNYLPYREGENSNRGQGRGARSQGRENGGQLTDDRCFNCGKTGHWKNECPNKGKNTGIRISAKANERN
uniref:CCHC-type domain-containing protein n=1 Tax=Myripristis murdjan TaxID=586833 RepID=A0A667XRT9_9TELE